MLDPTPHGSRRTTVAAAATLLGLLCACSGGPAPRQPHDPTTAPDALVDRFSAQAGTLYVRDATNGLPAAGAPIDMDTPRFLTKALGPNGEHIQYYTFDVRPTTPALIYIFYREGDTNPLPGQLPVIDAIPGEAAYNDFWRVTRVRVPPGYVANMDGSLAEIQADGYRLEDTTQIANCPVVPDLSTAALRVGGGDPGLFEAWYDDQIVYYFKFEEAPLTITASQGVPTAEIYVTFQINPGQPGGGPSSGYMTETGTDQTHNVAQAIPPDPLYSPLWLVSAYDNASFAMVTNWATADAPSTPVVASMIATVNCPVVAILP